MFSLAISCLTTPNSCLDLTFQVPMQYCFYSFGLFPSPVTSAAGCYFCFGSVSSFFLELFLHSSSVAYWAPPDLGSSSFSVISFCLFILFMGSSRGKILQWFVFPFSNGPSLIRILHHEPWVALHGMAHSFIELDKAVVHVISLITIL